MNINEDLVTQEIANLSIKVPQFWKPDPKIWFVQIEAQFRRSRIVSDQAKFDTVVSSIDADILSQVSEIVTDPPAENKYIAIKTKLISLYDESDTKKIQTLLTGMELGDQKPSQLLSRMRSLAQNKVSDDFLKALWLKQLPINAQTTLSICDENLSKLSEMADKIIDITTNHLNSTTSVSSIETQDSRITNLQKQVSELSNEIQSIYKNNLSQSKCASHNTDTRKSSPQQSLCYYHFNFGGHARKCTPPCLLSQLPLEQENSSPQVLRRHDRRGQK